MEKNLEKEKMISPSAAEMAKSIPGVFGIHLEEHADYMVDWKQDDLEIRNYAPCTMARVTLKGNYEDVKDLAFTKLANYIHGKNETQTKMEMTTPVWITATDGGWSMAFFMPKSVDAAAPAPTNPEVVLESFGQRIFAVIEYTGNVTEERMGEKQSELVAKLSEHPHLVPQGRLLTAQYDQPFAVPFLKTNEALIELRPSLV